MPDPAVAGRCGGCRRQEAQEAAEKANRRVGCGETLTFDHRLVDAGPDSPLPITVSRLVPVGEALFLFTDRLGDHGRSSRFAELTGERKGARHEIEVAEREALASQEMNLPRGETALDGVYAPVE